MGFSVFCGVRFTYRVRAPHHGTELERRAWEQRPIWFVGVLTGPDNLHHYEYIGQLRGPAPGAPTFDYGRKSRIGEAALSVGAWRWFWNGVLNHAAAGDVRAVAAFAGVEVYHEGRCGRCGRMLTVPTSIESGFGPDCIALVRGAIPINHARLA